MELSPFWIRAAALSGRLDLSAFVRDQLDPSTLSARPGELVRRGVRLDHAARLCATTEAEGDPAQRGISIVDSRYPAALAGIPFAPPVLFYEGALEPLQSPMVAVVGTRRCTPEGARHARQLSTALVRAGVVVVSGGAWGIDAEAHTAAEGSTIAVLGQGLGAPRTARLRRLCDRILALGGLLLSEFPGTHPAATYTFPMRNRVVAGLSSCTVVIEAGRRSGALITARLAAEAGRDVWAVPGDPHMASRVGCLNLLSDGARVYRNPTEVLEAIGLGSAPAALKPTHPLLRHLHDAPSLDTLLDRTQLPLPQLLRVLGGLQHEGLVRRDGTDRYTTAFVG